MDGYFSVLCRLRVMIGLPFSRQVSWIDWSCLFDAAFTSRAALTLINNNSFINDFLIESQHPYEVIRGEISATVISHKKKVK